MREIKFRAWHYEVGNPMYKPYMQYSSSTFDLPLFWRPVVDEPCSVEVMQYTGLQDKKGTEIYEGDILRTGQVESAQKPNEWRGQVKFDLGSFVVDDSYLKDSEEFQFEVIGNIYENPELLQHENAA